jgi:hypothetical protein
VRIVRTAVRKSGHDWALDCPATAAAFSPSPLAVLNAGRFAPGGADSGRACAGTRKSAGAGAEDGDSASIALPRRGVVLLCLLSNAAGLPDLALTLPLPAPALAPPALLAATSRTTAAPLSPSAMLPRDDGRSVGRAPAPLPLPLPPPVGGCVLRPPKTLTSLPVLPVRAREAASAAESLSVEPTDDTEARGEMIAERVTAGAGADALSAPGFCFFFAAYRKGVGGARRGRWGE